MKILALITDAFGGRGGIAKFNRDLLTALALDSRTSLVTAVPRLFNGDGGVIPPKIRFETAGANNKFRFVATAVRTAVSHRPYDWIICGHLNLLPFAAFLKKLCARNLLLVVHGVEGWKEGSPSQKSAMGSVDYLVVVSDFSRQRFLKWNSYSPPSCILPNAVDFTQFTPGPAPEYLITRHQLQGKKILLTLARLSAEEKYKGLDETLESIPALLRHIPNLLYLIAGDGNDRPRLEQKAKDLGVAAHVCFAGHIPEAEKTDYYRLADAFIMAGWGEGFGIVYLEALACGIPVIGSVLDASQEALLHGKLGLLVDPKNQPQMIAAIIQALALPKGIVPAELKTFSFPSFVQRCSTLISQMEKKEAV